MRLTTPLTDAMVMIRIAPAIVTLALLLIAALSGPVLAQDAAEPTSPPASSPDSTPASEPDSDDASAASEPDAGPASTPASQPASNPDSAPGSPPASGTASGPDSAPASAPASEEAATSPTSEPSSMGDATAAAAGPNTTGKARYICPMGCDGLVFHEPGTCPVCRMDLQVHPDDVSLIRKGGLLDNDPELAGLTDQLEEGGFFDAQGVLEDTKVARAKPKIPLMPGLPNWLFYASAALVVLVSFIGFEFRREGRTRRLPRVQARRTSERWRYPRVNLLRLGPLKKLVKWRGFPFVFQVPVVALFVFVIVAGLIGEQDASKNIAPVLTWNIWWMGLIFFAFLGGEVWCTVCPWSALPDWVNKLIPRIKQGVKRVASRTTGKKDVVKGVGPWRVAHRNLGLNLPWPRWARSVWPAAILFVAVTWLELAYEAPYRPGLTAILGLAMVVMAGASLLVFEHKGFCRHACFVGRVTGTYGTSGLLEIRRNDADTCRRCQTKDCLHGNERGNPCPTQEFMGAMNENTYCTMCTECLKSCPHDNIGINLRVPLADVLGHHKKRRDEAWFILLIFVISSFHGLAMIPVWIEGIEGARDLAEKHLGFDPGFLVTFTVGMAAFFGLLIGVYLLTCSIMKWSSRTTTRTGRDFFITFAYSLLPIALVYHLAHNALHVFYEGSKAIRLASDPFGWGWDLFGTADMPLTLLVPIQYLWNVQVVLVIVGHIVGIWIARRAALRLFPDKKQAARAHVPMVLAMVAFTVGSLWLLAQPMLMRTPGL